MKTSVSVSRNHDEDEWFKPYDNQSVKRDYQLKNISRRLYFYCTSVFTFFLLYFQEPHIGNQRPYIISMIYAKRTRGSYNQSELIFRPRPCLHTSTSANEDTF